MYLNALQTKCDLLKSSLTGVFYHPANSCAHNQSALRDRERPPLGAHIKIFFILFLWWSC